jgi:hypothetical protein
MKRLGQDPCTRSAAQRSLLVSYCKLCIEGKNINNMESLRANTITGYMREVNVLYRKRDLPPPIDFKDRANPVNILIGNLKAEEDIANQRSAFTPQMVAEFIKRGKEARHDSLESLAMNIICSGREMAYRASETSTSTQTKPDYYTYPGSKRSVIKAICENWWSCYDGNGNEVVYTGQNKATIVKMKIYWKFQKNRRNNEPVTYIRDDSEFCMVTNTLSMIDRAKELEQPDNLPLAVYRDKKGRKVYLTSTTLTKYIRDVARSAHPNMSHVEIQRFSCHSIRVWACVLLHEAGKKGDYIKKRLTGIQLMGHICPRVGRKLRSRHHNFINIMN